MLLQLVLAARWGWLACPVTALIAWALMGVEAAACEVFFSFVVLLSAFSFLIPFFFLAHLGPL